MMSVVQHFKHTILSVHTFQNARSAAAEGVFIVRHQHGLNEGEQLNFS